MAICPICDIWWEHGPDEICEQCEQDPLDEAWQEGRKAGFAAGYEQGVEDTQVNDE